MIWQLHYILLLAQRFKGCNLNCFKWTVDQWSLKQLPNQTALSFPLLRLLLLLMIIQYKWCICIEGTWWEGVRVEREGWISRIDRAVTSPSSLPLRVQNCHRETLCDVLSCWPLSFIIPRALSKWNFSHMVYNKSLQFYLHILKADLFVGEIV